MTHLAELRPYWWAFLEEFLIKDSRPEEQL